MNAYQFTSRRGAGLSHASALLYFLGTRAHSNGDCTTQAAAKSSPSNTPMKYRKLRIAWSVGWGVSAVLLMALWVRSYFIRDTAWLPTSRISVEISSLCG